MSHSISWRATRIMLLLNRWEQSSVEASSQEKSQGLDVPGHG